MRTRLALPLGLLALGALAAVPGRADTVYLANGRSFEGVLAEETPSQVLIRMPGGELKLPKSQVARVEKGDSSFAEYLERKQGLRRGSAADWLGLARWAQAHGLAHGTREAALKAAEIEPRLAGLGPILRGFGYAFDEGLNRWIPYEDAMRRRGFVQVNGQWLSRQELAERQRARDEEEQRRALRDAVEAAAAASRAQRSLAELTLYREAQRQEEPAPVAPYDPYYPALVWTGYLAPAFPPSHGHPGPGGGGGHHPRGGDGQRRHDFGQFVHRQPGSLFPLDSPISSRP